MPRNMSFALTTQQFKDRTKTVTRRKGWKFLKKGDILNGCVKCMGLKRGEKIEKLGQIKVLDVRREPLGRMMTDWAYGREELKKEGFPDYKPGDFFKLFGSQGVGLQDDITRIEFEYLDDWQ